MDSHTHTHTHIHTATHTHTHTATHEKLYTLYTIYKQLKKTDIETSNFTNCHYHVLSGISMRYKDTLQPRGPAFY